MTKYYSIEEPAAQFEPNKRARATGEFRPPLKGEWFLSGAIITAYKAYSDMTTAYRIAKIVKTKTITLIVEDVT